ncbi:MAG TPA: respiratory nitrate reductase subunit gamma [Anaeromyxobacteraceae bacterium]|nr:respiratory nitrate reductase subunit gamma [Anaeromyxobacteraceae bacterium]
MNGFLFGVVPYVAFGLFVVGSLRRFRDMRYTVTTSSSQMLESRLQFWGSVSWHYAILLVLAAHLVAIFLPGTMTALLSAPGRLVVIEVTGLALGITALWGLVVLGFRRLSLRGETTWLDWTVMALLLLQVATGVYTAVAARWGYAWFTHVATPWLASLVRLSPRTDLLAVMPWPFQVHAVNAFVLLALVPFTRLAHAFVAPVEYLWRLPQVVIWRRPRPATPGGSR